MEVLGPIQIDDDAIYQGSTTFLYRHRYGKTYGSKKGLQWSHWTERKSNSFIAYFRRKGYDISIWRTTKKKKYEDEE